jgi:LuxR family maltose regulon positive regulatory protein
MARTTPRVEDARLIDPSSPATAIMVGTPLWYAWLERATTFAFVGSSGRFTARKERRGRADGYWRAYRRHAGVLHGAYLGQTADLTLQRLQDVAVALTTPAVASDTSRQAVAGPAASPILDEPPAPAPAVGLPLLTTKLTLPPARANLVARPRLIALMAKGIAGKLTLIAAPAGFGKTTLLAQGLGAGSWGSESAGANSQLSTPNSRSVAWLALDSGDNDPTTFLRCLIAALQQVMPVPVGTLALALIQAPQPPALTTLLTMLINDLVGIHLDAVPPRRFALVLDDYHVVTAPAIHEALTFLLNHLPPPMHLVIASRDDPPLPLAQLRARGELTEIRAVDLRFRPDEAAS